jgi:predicted nucleic acid-binding protein
LGSRVVVDSAPFIFVLDGRGPFAKRYEGLFQSADAGEILICLSTISFAEILTGPFQAGNTALAHRYERMLSQYEVLPVTAAIASIAAQLRAQYCLKLPDAIQLATALDTEAAALVTHDRDFSKVDALPIISLHSPAR